MAERKPSGFRFRLPWLLQPAITSRPAIAPEPPRTTTQPAVASTPAQRPPFRPPGIAPAPAAPPPMLATPASPTRAPPRSTPLQVSVASSVPPKSSAPESAIAKTLDPVSNKPTKETQPTSETPISLAAARTANDGETQPTKETPAATEIASPATPPPTDKIADNIETRTTSETLRRMVPLAAARTVDAGETQPTKGTQAATAMASPAAQPAIDKVADSIETQTTSKTPGPAVPLEAARTAEASEIQAAKEMARPATPPAIAKVANTIESQPTKETLTTTGIKPTIEALAPATPPRSPPLRPPSPVHVQPLQTGTSRRSPSRLASQPTDKPSSPSITTSAVPHKPEIKMSSDITREKVPTDSNHVTQGADLALDAKPKEIAKVKGAQTKSLNPDSMDKITETKSQKPKPIASARLSLHREIKDDIFKFIRKMATSPPKRYIDEKPASVVTVAGDNTGASMHLGSDAIKREGGVDIQRGYRSADDNGEGSSNDKKSRRDTKSSENQEPTAIVNSNIQGINNSMMFNSSVTERNPGVHLGFSRNLANTNDSKMENRESMETYRAEANITPQKTLIYDPTIRRYHEGVSMEGCDLEADDPEKSGKGYVIEVL